jgi:hypothetical protein
MKPLLIKIAALERGISLKGMSGSAGINTRRFYRLIEGLAVPTEEELTRVATVTGLSLEQVRAALTSSETSVRRAG